MSDKPNVNPSPRTRFQSTNGFVTAHRAMIESAAFDRGADAAMLQYQSEVSQQVKDGNSAVAAGFRIQGAQEFLQMFKTLAEQAARMTPRKDYDNLPDPTRQ